MVIGPDPACGPSRQRTTAHDGMRSEFGATSNFPCNCLPHRQNRHEPRRVALSLNDQLTSCAWTGPSHPSEPLRGTVSFSPSYRKADVDGSPTPDLFSAECASMTWSLLHKVWHVQVVPYRRRPIGDFQTVPPVHRARTRRPDSSAGLGYGFLLPQSRIAFTTGPRLLPLSVST
jgi:hypothetical protein